MTQKIQVPWCIYNRSGGGGLDDKDMGREGNQSLRRGKVSYRRMKIQ